MPKQFRYIHVNLFVLFITIVSNDSRYYAKEQRIAKLQERLGGNYQRVKTTFKTG